MSEARRSSNNQARTAAVAVQLLMLLGSLKLQYLLIGADISSQKHLTK
jgi:hypothetical protein